MRFIFWLDASGLYFPRIPGARVKKWVGAMVSSSRPCDDGRGPICSRASWGAGLSIALWSLVLDGESESYSHLGHNSVHSTI